MPKNNPAKPSPAGRSAAENRLLLRVAASRDGLAERDVASMAEPAAVLVAADLAAWTGAGPARRLVATEPGRARARRLAGPRDHAFLAQHRSLAERGIDYEGAAQVALVDDSESPLAWLRRRAGKDGRPFLNDAQFQAGERLRADITLGQMLPRVTADWSGTGGGRRGPPREHIADVALAARQRCDAAGRALGGELFGVLLDVCGFLKGLETVERERSWPARSAKLVLRIALDRLATHYGLSNESTGPASAKPRKWGAPDYRPTVV